MAQDVTQMLENPQQIEAVVSGPGGANRLYICTGIAPTYAQARASEMKETYLFSVGPVLTPQQFIGATATAGLAQVETWPMAGSTAGPGNNQWRIVSADADWDDEGGRVQARIEVAAAGSADINAAIAKTGYQVTILAQIT